MVKVPPYLKVELSDYNEYYTYLHEQEVLPTEAGEDGLQVEEEKPIPEESALEQQVSLEETAEQGEQGGLSARQNGGLSARQGGVAEGGGYVRNEADLGNGGENEPGYDPSRRRYRTNEDGQLVLESESEEVEIDGKIVRRKKLSISRLGDSEANGQKGQRGNYANNRRRQRKERAPGEDGAEGAENPNARQNGAKNGADGEQKQGKKARNRKNRQGEGQGGANNGAQGGAEGGDDANTSAQNRGNNNN